MTIGQSSLPTSNHRLRVDTMTSTSPSPWRIVRNALLAAGALLLVAIVTHPLWLAPLVSRHLSARSGRAAQIDTMWIGLSSSLAPVLHLRGIHIANAPWADSDRPFAALASAIAVFSWKSIEQRRPVIALLTLTDGEVDLQRTADGLRNWRLANPEYRGPGRWKVLAVRGEHATVRFVHGGIDLDVRATASAATAADTAASGPPRSTHIDLQGHWRRLPFSASADTGPVLTFLETGETFPVRGRLEAGGARLDLDGTAGDIVRRPIADATVSLAAPSLAPFSAFIGSRQHEAKTIRVAGTLKTGDGRYALTAATARVGATDLAGDASWTRSDEKSVVRAKLESDSTDVADLRWLAGLAPARARAASAEAGASGAATSLAASGATASQRGVRDLDAELSFVARRLRAADVSALQSGRIDAALAGGRLTVSRFDIGLSNGHVTGRASLGLHDAPMQGDAEVSVAGVRIEGFARDASGRSRLHGAVQGHAQLKASGDSADALRDSVSGRITASLTGGTISSLLDAEIGLQGGKIVRSLIAGAEPIAIRCAAATLDLERGTGRFRTLVVDTERTRTTGTGTIDLAAETVDIVLTPEAKQSGLFNLERSIRLHGPLRRPARELIARAKVSANAAGGCRSRSG